MGIGRAGAATMAAQFRWVRGVWIRARLELKLDSNGPSRALEKPPRSAKSVTVHAKETLRRPDLAYLEAWKI